jgi:hypothetical protein
MGLPLFPQDRSRLPDKQFMLSYRIASAIPLTDKNICSIPVNVALTK